MAGQFFIDGAGIHDSSQDELGGVSSYQASELAGVLPAVEALYDGRSSWSAANSTLLGLSKEDTHAMNTYSHHMTSTPKPKTTAHFGAAVWAEMDGGRGVLVG